MLTSVRVVCHSQPSRRHSI